MRKFIVSAAIVLSTGLLATSCKKQVIIRSATVYNESTVSDRKDIGSAD